MIPPAISLAAAGDTRRQSPLNFTALQLILFAGSGMVGLAALLATGWALGLALAGAAMIAVAALMIWVIAANMIGRAVGRNGRPPAP